MLHLCLIFRQSLGKMKQKIQFSGLFPEEKKKQNQNETISDHLMIHPIPNAEKSLVSPQPEESMC